MPQGHRQPRPQKPPRGGRGEFEEARGLPGQKAESAAGGSRVALVLTPEKGVSPKSLVVNDSRPSVFLLVSNSGRR